MCEKRSPLFSPSALHKSCSDDNNFALYVRRSSLFLIARTSAARAILRAARVRITRAREQYAYL